MKKLAVLLVAIVAIFGVAKADNDRPVNVNQLPKAAQVFVKKHFAGKQVALAKEDKGFINSSYDVIFTDGSKVEFDGKGNWKEVKCSKVPVAIVPAQIAAKARELYKDAVIVKIEKKDNGGYEVKLSNRQELEFNRQLQLTDIDD